MPDLTMSLQVLYTSPGHETDNHIIDDPLNRGAVIGQHQIALRGFRSIDDHASN